MHDHDLHFIEFSTNHMIVSRITPIVERSLKGDTSAYVPLDLFEGKPYL